MTRASISRQIPLVLLNMPRSVKSSRLRSITPLSCGYSRLRIRLLRCAVLARPRIRSLLPPPADPPKKSSSASLSQASVCGPGSGVQIGRGCISSVRSAFSGPLNDGKDSGSAVVVIQSHVFCLDRSTAGASQLLRFAFAPVVMAAPFEPGDRCTPVAISSGLGDHCDVEHFGLTLSTVDLCRESRESVPPSEQRILRNADIFGRCAQGIARFEG